VTPPLPLDLAPLLDLANERAEEYAAAMGYGPLADLDEDRVAFARLLADLDRKATRDEWIRWLSDDRWIGTDTGALDLDALRDDPAALRLAILHAAGHPAKDEG
jgi:hypothetical protein